MDATYLFMKGTITTDVRILRWSSYFLTAIVWASAGLFGLYILAFYASALYTGDMEKWNGVLPGLYTKESTASNAGVGIHFATGGIILILGSIQMIDSIRLRFPAVHRWIGRIYIIASLLTAVGGLVFIFIKGTICGTVMDIGFGLYGVLMLIAAIETYRHARAGRLQTHEAWAIRLYALAIGSFLYRMDYGFWMMLTGGVGHEEGFSGSFDMIMAFMFYLPNLLVAEILIRTKGNRGFGKAFNSIFSIILIILMLFLLTGTYYFTKFYWGPAIIEWVQ